MQKKRALHRRRKTHLIKQLANLNQHILALDREQSAKEVADLARKQRRLLNKAATRRLNARVYKVGIASYLCFCGNQGISQMASIALHLALRTSHIFGTFLFFSSSRSAFVIFSFCRAHCFISHSRRVPLFSWKTTCRLRFALWEMISPCRVTACRICLRASKDAICWRLRFVKSATRGTFLSVFSLFASNHDETVHLGRVEAIMRYQNLTYIT